MKKILSLFLYCLMVLTLTGCGGSNGDDITTYTYSSELDIKNLDRQMQMMDVHSRQFMQ